MAELRDLFIASGNVRRYVNTQTRCSVRIFKFGVSRELVEPDRLVALELPDALRFGQTTAKESKVVEAIDIEAVRLNAKDLSPVLTAMVRIQASSVGKFAFGCTDLHITRRSTAARPRPFRSLKGLDSMSKGPSK